MIYTHHASADEFVIPAYSKAREEALARFNQQWPNNFDSNNNHREDVYDLNAMDMELQSPEGPTNANYFPTKDVFQAEAQQNPGAPWQSSEAPQYQPPVSWQKPQYPDKDYYDYSYE